MMDGGLANRFLLFSTLKNRQNVVAIFGGVRRELFPDDGRTGGHQVGQTNHLVALAARSDLSGPADDEGDAMPSLPVVVLASQELTGTVMPMISFALELRHVRPVVAGEDHQGVVGHA